MHELSEREYFPVSENSRVAELAQMNLSSALYFCPLLLFGGDLMCYIMSYEMEVFNERMLCKLENLFLLVQFS